MGARAISADSFVSTTATGVGDAHQPSTGAPYSCSQPAVAHQASPVFQRLPGLAQSPQLPPAGQPPAQWVYRCAGHPRHLPGLFCLRGMLTDQRGFVARMHAPVAAQSSTAPTSLGHPLNSAGAGFTDPVHGPVVFSSSSPKRMSTDALLGSPSAVDGAGRCTVPNSTPPAARCCKAVWTVGGCLPDRSWGCSVGY